MRKKSRVLKDVPFKGSGIIPAVNPFINFVFLYRLFTMRAFKADLKQLNLSAKQLSYKTGNQVYIPSLHQFSKIKNINNSIPLLSYNIGLVFVFIVSDPFNTPILSL